MIFELTQRSTSRQVHEDRLDDHVAAASVIRSTCWKPGSAIDQHLARVVVDGLGGSAPSCLDFDRPSCSRRDLIEGQRRRLDVGVAGPSAACGCRTTKGRERSAMRLGRRFGRSRRPFRERRRRSGTPRAGPIAGWPVGGRRRVVGLDCAPTSAGAGLRPSAAPAGRSESLPVFARSGRSSAARSGTGSSLGATKRCWVGVSRISTAGSDHRRRGCTSRNWAAAGSTTSANNNQGTPATAARIHSPNRMGLLLQTNLVSRR